MIQRRFVELDTFYDEARYDFGRTMLIAKKSKNV